MTLQSNADLRLSSGLLQACSFFGPLFPVYNFAFINTGYTQLLLFGRPLNPLKAKLNPICHLLALLGAHHILHISRIRVNRLL